MVRLASIAFLATFLAVDAVSPIGDIPIWQMFTDQARDALALGTDEQLANQSFENKCKKKSILSAYNKIQDGICNAKVKIDLPNPPDFRRDLPKFSPVLPKFN